MKEEEWTEVLNIHLTGMFLITKTILKFMLKNKIYFAPSAYEAGFVSSAHTANNINYTLDIFEKWIKN